MNVVFEDNARLIDWEFQVLLRESRPEGTDVDADAGALTSTSKADGPSGKAYLTGR